MKLKNIDKSKVKGEYKVNIYSRYALTSMRYHLSIHDIHKIHLEKLEDLAETFLKKWLNFPSISVKFISVKSESTMSTHSGNYALMRIKTDSTVNQAVDLRLEIETLWTNKSSTISHCDQIFQDHLNSDKFFIPTIENSFSLESARRDQICKAKTA